MMLHKMSLFLMMAEGDRATTPTPAQSKSANYQAAVARATGKPGTVDTGRKTEAIGDAAAMFSKFEASELNTMAKSGKYEFAPQMMSLEPGMKVEGILEGYGPGNDFVNEETGEVRHVDSWIIASPDGTLRVSILSSTQLDVKLLPFIGQPVIIARNNDIKLAGGHRCGDYHVGGPRQANGEARRWGVIPAAPTPPSLPAGTVDANVVNANAPALPAGTVTNGAAVS
jgi:hypothetical protein